MLKFASIVTVMLLAGGPGSAQPPLTGTWQGTTDGGASLVLELTAKGSTLTGTLSRDGQRSPLADGKVDKNTFTFKATLNEKTEDVSGELKDDELRVWLDRQGPDKAVVLTRAKSKTPER